MEKKHHRYGFVFVLCIIISLDLVSFISCLIAEAKKAKRKDLKLDGKLCYLPESHAHELGIAALICLGVAQVIGNLLICRIFCTRDKRNNCKTQKLRIATALLVLSCRISFGVAVILLGAATSMSRKQPYGKGWLDRECYLVKDGVFVGSGGLVLVSSGSIVAAAIVSSQIKTQVEQRRKVHAQI
ncbi:protein MODIFYING WALL LIGNIN-1-like [Citrus sinensis]|uniref:protein MODIFYING WALL LIGNIN-1-like n=1 Tax=Citrus sinensis TaxID=2711 RepID=UPI0022790AE3|nr:protein MODIFYING WALL LIGNIN-1-like [Citrus sinensis]